MEQAESRGWLAGQAWARLFYFIFIFIICTCQAAGRTLVVNMSCANLGGFSSHRMMLTAGDARKMRWKMASTVRAREPRSRLQDLNTAFSSTRFMNGGNCLKEGQECWFQFLITSMCRCCHFPDCSRQVDFLADFGYTGTAKVHSRWCPRFESDFSRLHTYPLSVLSPLVG